MRIFLALSVIIISIHNGRCKIDLKRDKEVIIDIDSPELHQSQYHTADFDTSAYNYGYAVEPNGQFHHETRGGDGVTYGCYGYIDSDDLLKVTHYVADSQGYRTLEHEKPVLVYPVNENTVDADEKPYKPKGVMLDWKDLYFPIGCGMAKGGVILNAPVIRAPGGIFQQLGETKFPVQPSPEPKVVVPRIPFNSPMKTEPTKLIPISTVVSTYTKQQSPRTTAPVIFSSPEGVNPSTRTTQRPTINSNTPTKPSTINAHVNGPEYATKISYRQNQHSTVPPIVNSSNHPTRAGTSPSPFRESVTNGPSTVKTPSDKFILQKVTPSISPLGQSDYTEDLLPPFRTTNKFDTHTTIGLPINSFNPGNDLNVINSYVNSYPDTPTTTEPSYFGDITTVVPIQSQPFSTSYNNNGPSTVVSTKYPAIDSTEKISSIRPTNFDGFKFNTQTTTGTPFDLATESNVDSTNPDSSTVYTDAESLSTPADERSTPYASRRPIETSHSTLSKSSSSRQDSTSKTFGVTSSVASQRPAVESYTTTDIDVEFETTTSQSTYPGIGDYNKPQAGFEFNIPTRAPSQASTSTPRVQSFVTISNVEPVESKATPQNSVDTNSVDNKAPTYDKTTTFITNGPHGAEYQLGSRNPHSQYGIGNLNFLNPIKQSRKDADDARNPPISLITPLTHLTISGSFPSKNNDTTDSSAQQPSTPIASDRTPIYGNQYSVSEVINPSRPSTVHPERESTRPNQPSGFFTVTTPKNEPIRGIITHMNAISQTRFQPSRMTPSVAPSDEPNTNDVISNQPDDHSNPRGQINIRPEITHNTRPELVGPTEYPFLYTRSRTTSANAENTQYPDESRPGTSSPDLITKAPNDQLKIYSGFGQRIIPGVNPATTSFTAYNPGSTPTPLNEVDGGTPSTNRVKGNSVPYDNSPHQPKFVLRPTVRPASNSNRQPSSFNGYPDAVNRNANFYPDSNAQKASDNNQNNIQPVSKYANTKTEFIPQYNPSSTPIPGSLGTAIGVYPPNVDQLVPEIPNFNIAISKWPFYILPFPFANDNLMTFPFLGGMPIQFGSNVLPTANLNPGTNPTSGNDYVQGASSVGVGGNGPPAQTICSWLSSFIKARENATKTEVPTNENGETLQISNLQVNLKNAQQPINQNQIPFGIVGFIPVIAVPNCQHNVQGDKLDANVFPNSIQLPNLCTQLSHLLGNPSVTAKDTNQPSSAT
ncbi:uncharacterized protein LOC119075495 isoform X2 [Bradysia coprophila]|uniref:uncharacterized protein LOC119075495 isoform X2 n=1 Tax=Bradysia coprophila TaxID=38358 RepID=UPI00187DA420|nr:uncharacterized protein LOC119075495 isoform X2 [Bradysia coprophila]